MLLVTDALAGFYLRTERESNFRSFAAFNEVVKFVTELRVCRIEILVLIFMVGTIQVAYMNAIGRVARQDIDLQLHTVQWHCGRPTTLQ